MFAWTRKEKIRRSRLVREDMAQYQRMQRNDMRDVFPDWFEKEAQALDHAKVTLDTMIAEHNREVESRARRVAKTVRKEQG